MAVESHPFQRAAMKTISFAIAGSIIVVLTATLIGLTITARRQKEGACD